ncbi:hypothetical protein LTR49_018387 [Elasticomyces elasticus]|nr:hypothetical protein LTR49_018387 [Elasticomyces elasticus]KAK5749036.1 hypothetical protein LTS12_020934 [Elasticomyces elasticus]
MAEVGAVASIIGIITFGFSLATQITTYIGDFEDASEDIKSLAGEVSSTFRHIEQLQALVDSHATTKAFSDSGLLEAEACKVKARQLADRLWKLVKKSNATFPPDGELSADQLNITIFSKALWPRFKPRVDQHKHELVVLNTNIMICMVGYRLQIGAPAADQARATDELDRLKRSKKLALHSLREAQKRRKRKKNKGQDDRRPHFSDDRQMPGRQGSGGSLPPRPRDNSYDDRDGETWVPDEEDIDRLVVDLRKDILLEIEEENVAKKRTELEMVRQKEEAVAQYKSDLLQKLHESTRDSEGLRQALVKTFPETLSQNAVTRFVDERQLEKVQDDEVAQLMTALVPHQPVKTSTTSEKSDSMKLDSRKHRGRRLAETLRNYALARRLGKQTRITDITIFSVIVSVDGDKHRATPITVPTPWTDKLLAEQEKKGWWKGASFRETLSVYSTLDLKSRELAEDEADKQGIDSGQLILLYARLLDKRTTKGRKLLEATMMAANPWEYLHGRALLVYKVSSGNDPERHDAGTSTSNSYADGGRHGDYERVRPYSANGSPKPYGVLRVDYDDEERDTRRRRESRADPRLDSGSRNEYETGNDGRRPHHHEQHAGLDERYTRDEQYSPYAQRSQWGADYGRREMDIDRRYSYFREPVASGMSDYQTRDPYDTSGRHESHRPMYPKVHQKYLLPETLSYYGLPYEYDRSDPGYIIILRDMDQYETEILFEHTKRLRAGPIDPVHYRRSRYPSRESSFTADYRNGKAPVATVYNDVYGPGRPVHQSRSRSGMYSPPVEVRLSPYPGFGATSPRDGNSRPDPRERAFRPPEHIHRLSDDDCESRGKNGRVIEREEIIIRRSDARDHEASRSQNGGARFSDQREKANAAFYARNGQDLEREDLPVIIRESDEWDDDDRRNRDESVRFSDGRGKARAALHRERSAAPSRSRDDSFRGYEHGGRATPYRPSSALSAARSSGGRSESTRSRIRSRAEAYDRSRDTGSVAEVVDDQDSPSDLFESEMSDDDSGNERTVSRKPAEVRRSRGSSNASSMLGLESTTESPSSLSDVEASENQPRSKLSSRSGQGRHPEAETVTEESSRQNTTDAMRALESGEFDPRRNGRVERISTFTSQDTDDDAAYQTAAESHGGDLFEEVTGDAADESLGRKGSELGELPETERVPERSSGGLPQ